MQKKWLKHISTLFAILALMLVMIPSVASATSDTPSSGTPDGTPPVLTEFSLAATSMTAPGSIEVTAAATDDVSGVSSFNVQFYCEETRKTLYGHLYSTYWNEGEQIPYADGKLHGVIEADEYLESGEFLLEYIYITDNAGNTQWYENDPSTERLPFPDFITQRKITVTSSSSVDGTPPVLTGLTLATNELTAPGSIEVTASASDNSSGVSSVNVQFYCEETRKTLYGHLYSTYWDNGEHVPYPDGKLHGVIEADEYLESGEFLLEYIYVTDYAGNTQWYEDNPSTGRLPFPDSITQRKITVTASSAADGTPPVLTSLALATTKITAPGSIEVTANASDNSSGVSSVNVQFYCEETRKTLYGHLYSTYWDNGEHVPYPDGKLHGFIEIDQYLEAGEFLLEYIYVTDKAGNTQWYEDDPISSRLPFPDSITQRKITVLNAVPDVTTSVANSDFVKQLEDTADDAYIVADYSGDATLPSDAFDAIAGTDKTLDLVSDGVTWRFNGNDIKNDSKPIDLNVVIETVEEHPSDDSSDIQEALEDKSAIVMQFPENGQLPGAATIQLKVDHVMREYLGGERNLSVYYFNNQTGELELVARDLMIINDTFVEFTITHCSHYVLVCEDEPFPFVDVPNGSWYLNSVKWAVANKITSGIDATHFGPENPCTRGQIVSFLWRAAGSPEPTSDNNPFKDVKSSDYFYKAVLWAVENNITAGTSATTFAPSSPCTRGQIVTFLWRYNGEPDAAASNEFTDVPSGQYYTPAVAWAVKNNITSGVGNGRFAPNNTCTRAQIVAFLYRSMK